MDTRPETKKTDLSLISHLGMPGSISELVDQLIGFARRQFPIFVVIFVCAMALGVVYLFTAPGRYTAHTSLLIDNSKMRVLQQQQSALGDIPLDTAQVETQVEVLKSETIGLSVIKELRLTEDQDFIGGGGGIVGAVAGLVSGFFQSGVDLPSEAASEFELTRRALGVFLGQRTITRVGRTYVLDIAFTATNAERAATIANAIGDAYIVDQLEAKYQATRRASTWLQDRINELRTQASVADKAVLEYKEKNNIVSAGGAGGGQLLGEQQLTELNSQLTTARAATGEAKARLERVNEVMKQDVPDAAVADSLRSEVINRLRNQYLDIAARERIWSGRYGPTHIAAVNLRTQMVEIRRSIVEELGRIAESYKSDYEIAKAREETLEKNLANLVEDSKATNRDRLGLRELESSAQVYRSIYDSFLQRYMEAIQQQSFPITEARVISLAAPPAVKSSPRPFLVLGVAGVLGLLLSVAAATLREAVDRVFRTSRQVEDMLGTNCLAVLPALKKVATTPTRTRKPKKLIDKIQPAHRLIVASNSALRQVALEPLSHFAEAFRSIKIAADISGTIKENRVIGVTSTLPKEGKSTVASNFAQLIADAGKRVILVDGDLRNPTLTRNLAADAKFGLLEVLAGKLELQAAIFKDDRTGLEFLPAVIESRLAHTNEILASEPFKRLIETLRKTYDYVIVDLPPLAPVVDVRATINIIDSYVYVIEWGRTQMNVVQHHLTAAPELYDRLLGFVLNKADTKVLKRYEYYYGNYYHKQYYSRYGYGGNTAA